MVLVHFQIVHCVQQGVQELVGRNKIVKVLQGSNTCDPGVMRVKCNEVVDAQLKQLVEHVGSIQRFPPAAVMLASLIQERHNDRDTSGFALDHGDHSLQVLEMVIR